jgi:hypothetical protein
LKRLPCLAPVIAGLCFASTGNAQAPGRGSGAEPLAEPRLTWLGRVSVGLNPVVSRTEYLPKAHLGFGVSLAGFVKLPYRFNAGLGFDWERYTFDSENMGDGNQSPPRYTDQVLTHSRVMGLVQWDVLPRRFITPFLLVGAGYGWEHSQLTQWQCTPALGYGLVVGGGVGLDIALSEIWSLGVEYRANTLPMGPRNCNPSFIFAEPRGAPSDFFSQRIGVTLSVEY